MNPINDPKDELLWKQARRRVAFKRQLAAYIIVNSFFWALFFFSGTDKVYSGKIPWPIWPMLGWGIGIAFSYYKAYMADEPNAVEKEYEKLKDNR